MSGSLPPGLTAEGAVGWIAAQVEALVRSHGELRDELRISREELRHSRDEQRQENHDLEIRLTDLLAPIQETLNRHEAELQGLKDARVARNAINGLGRWAVRGAIAVLPFAAGWFGRDLPR